MKLIILLVLTISSIICCCTRSSEKDLDDEICEKVIDNCKNNGLSIQEAYNLLIELGCYEDAELLLLKYSITGRN
ncbi:hypothetical protein CONCODRAFT_8548 [Conidiobolus coronatus NRRL 28638]|uniref:UBA domain-containing protein n=1 Tax=Conidiobolus coronatus (strain ATCC 28846 / CBS 209.66 / NRRL 28638) TaxID=796925 RepID=A0A137P2D7_CONC2|nr:hypothetical protein CONCODRAFT_8548 [Conidiobolus coronatus NRRL 28638]|eukprot:KXN69064.1 hypothetical protein CONCODRAFT_8548 [Conidiobolus coronatus NRRL 28638]